MKVSTGDCKNLERTLALEWLETNGRGGFASGTIAGPNTRRYHALLLVARKPPVERVVLVNHLEEYLDTSSGSFPLSTNLYPGAVHPDGYRRCVGFSSEPWPTWAYELDGIKVMREIFSPRGRDLVVVRWHLAELSTRSVRLVIRPMLTGRDYHSLHHENGAIHTEAAVRDGLVAWQPYRDLRQIRALHRGEYRHQPDWFRRVHYPMEQERGLDYEEDWWSPGEIVFTFSQEGSASLVFTTELVDTITVDALAKDEQRRRKAVRTGAPKGDPLVRSLWCATEAYISERGKQQTVIAGYP
ncbi:MAG TPA: glycogen debranching enzyme N-terminal domain-containing protein, partial [Nitrospiraceae bacterium]|nr:glycogen debranching enzyme N-terminal domain-containing protein [Nitrospiraceae bacterium]